MTMPTPAAISRRAALVPLVAAGSLALAAGTAAAQPNHARPLVMTAAATSSLAELRIEPVPTDPDAIYFVRDIGQEGHFRYDPADTTSADNTGLTIVSTSGARFKRIFDGAASVRWFGAKGDNVTDDTAAIQLAIDTVQEPHAPVGGQPGTGIPLYFPPALGYGITAPLVIDSLATNLRIFGDNSRTQQGSLPVLSSTIRVLSSVSSLIDAVFRFSDAASNIRGEIVGLGIDGNQRARYGIHSRKIEHTYFHRLWIRGTYNAAIAVGYGWCNDIDSCELSYNIGDAILCTDRHVNQLNVVNTKIFANGGIGIHVPYDAMSMQVRGCTVEANKKAAIYVRQGIWSLVVDNNYIEKNAETGLQFANPSRLVKAHIVLNGNDTPAEAFPGRITAASPSRTVRITDNFVESRYDNSFVAAYAVSSALVIQRNSIFDQYSAGARPVPHAAVVVGTSRTGAGAAVQGLDVADNRLGNYAGFVAADVIRIEDPIDAWSPHFHTAVVRGAKQVNFSAALAAFAVVEPASTVGSFAATGERYFRQPVFGLTGSAATAVWGFTLDLANDPELAGQLVHFAVSVNAPVGSAVHLFSDAAGRSQGTTATGQWVTVSQVMQLPTSGTVRIGVATSGTAGNTVRFAAPVLALLGASYAELL